MKQQLYLATLAGMNIFVAFLSQLVIYTRLGPGVATDAFIAAATIPQMLVTIISIPLSSVLVPLFAGESHNSQNKDGWTILYMVGVLFISVTALLFLSAPWWIRWLFPGFDLQTYLLCISLVRIQMFSMVFLAMGAVITAIYYARNQFILVESWTLLPSTISIILMYLFLPKYGIELAAWLLIGRSFIQFVILIPALGKPTGFRGISPQVRDAWKRIKPILAGNAYYKTDILVDRYLLSMGSSGDISLYGLAQQIYSASSSIIGKVWGTTAIPRLSILFKEKNQISFLSLYWRRVGFLFFLSLGFYTLFLLFGAVILDVLVGHSKMTSQNTHTLWVLMTCLGGMFVLGCTGTVLAGAYYAIGDTRTPAYMSMVTFTLFILVKYFAFKFHGIIGVSLATSIYYIINASLLALLFKKRLRSDVVYG